jgi:hypothetical protein
MDSEALQLSEALSDLILKADTIVSLLQANSHNLSEEELEEWFNATVRYLNVYDNLLLEITMCASTEETVH